MTTTIKAICLWLDTTSDPSCSEGRETAWLVTKDELDQAGRAETTNTLHVFGADKEDEALEAAKAAARKAGLPLYRNDDDKPIQYLGRSITISGNWRAGGPENEWAGTGSVDKYGAVECSAEIGDEAYEAIQEQIESGDYDGEVTVHDDDQDRDVTYIWSMDW